MDPVIATDYTDSNGNFSFNGLPNGKYVMEIADNAGQLINYQGTTADAQAGYRGETIASASLTGEHFGYAGLGPIGDTVFSDHDGDGLPGCWVSRASPASRSRSTGTQRRRHLQSRAPTFPSTMHDRRQRPLLLQRLSRRDLFRQH